MPTSRGKKRGTGSTSGRLGKKAPRITTRWGEQVRILDLDGNVIGSMTGDGKRLEERGEPFVSRTKFPFRATIRAGGRAWEVEVDGGPGLRFVRWL